MLKILTGKYSSYLLIAGMLLVAYIAYVFSFSHAVEAVRLNRQLSAEKGGDRSFSVSYPQLENQHRFYTTVLKSYHVKKENRENRLWQVLSGIALSKNVAITFVPVAPAPIDTLAEQKGIVGQQFTVKGKYSNLVSMIDSIARTAGIGKIADLKLNHKKNDTDHADATDLTMQLRMVALAVKN